MDPTSPASRREFLAALGGATAAGLAAARPDDPPSAAANLGSLFPDVERLAAGNRYAYSFLGDRFRSLADFQAAAREKVFELLLYRPEKVDPRPEVVERTDQGDHVREKVLFS